MLCLSSSNNWLVLEILNWGQFNKTLTSVTYRVAIVLGSQNNGYTCKGFFKLTPGYSNRGKILSKQNQNKPKMNSIRK